MDKPTVSPRCAQQMLSPFALRYRAGHRILYLHCKQISFCWHRQGSVTQRGRSATCKAQSGSRGATSTLQETATLDKLIDLMLSARSSKELGKIVGENLLAFDQKFWLRLATRSDTAATAEEKKRLQDLAGMTMRMVDAMVKKSDNQLTDSAAVLQKILVAAADESGHWQLPLSDEKVEAMRKEIEANAEALDESVLANAFAWMRKAKSDNLDGTVALIQQALQLYSAQALGSQEPQSEAEDAVLDHLLSLKEADWISQLESASAQGTISESSFLAAVRRKMERVVLSLPSGSYAQRVQAEYLKELETRAESFFKR